MVSVLDNVITFCGCIKGGSRVDEIMDDIALTVSHTSDRPSRHLGPIDEYYFNSYISAAFNFFVCFLQYHFIIIIQ